MVVWRRAMDGNPNNQPADRDGWRVSARRTIPVALTRQTCLAKRSSAGIVTGHGGVHTRFRVNSITPAPIIAGGGFPCAGTADVQPRQQGRPGFDPILRGADGGTSFPITDVANYPCRRRPGIDGPRRHVPGFASSHIRRPLAGHDRGGRPGGRGCVRRLRCATAAFPVRAATSAGFPEAQPGRRADRPLGSFSDDV